MKHKQAKEKRVEASRQHWKVEGGGTGLLYGQRHAVVEEEYTQHKGQPW